jgi:hypothetical protein
MSKNTFQDSHAGETSLRAALSTGRPNGSTRHRTAIARDKLQKIWQMLQLSNATINIAASSGDV